MTGAPDSSGPVALHPALPFSVDTWDAGPSGARPAFLSHAHKDHTAGLAAWAAAGGRPSRRIFATEDTLALLALRGEGVRARPGVEVVPVVQGEAMFVAQEGFPAFQVTPLDANHGVRGSVMFLFQGAFGTVLHTGDCRLTPSVVSSVQAAMPPDTPLDLVYLDCTFASYRKEFPSVRDALRHAEEAAMRHSLASRVYIGCDGLGCESLLEQLAMRLGQRVYMPPPGCGIAFHGKDIEAQRLAELRMLLPEGMLTQDPNGTLLHICGGRELQEAARRMTSAAQKRGEVPPLFIRPSVQMGRMEKRYNTGVSRPGSHGMEKAPTSAVLTEGVWHVLYSNHSSLPELRDALESLRPRHVVPHSSDKGGWLPPEVAQWQCASGGEAEVLRLEAPPPLPRLRPDADALSCHCPAPLTASAGGRTSPQSAASGPKLPCPRSARLAGGTPHVDSLDRSGRQSNQAASAAAAKPLPAEHEASWGRSRRCFGLLRLKTISAEDGEGEAGGRIARASLAQTWQRDEARDGDPVLDAAGRVSCEAAVEGEMSEHLAPGHRTEGQIEQEAEDSKPTGCSKRPREKCQAGTPEIPLSPAAHSQLRGANSSLPRCNHYASSQIMLPAAGGEIEPPLSEGAISPPSRRIEASEEALLFRAMGGVLPPPPVTCWRSVGTP